ncbi:hypothetical protein FHP29_01845 [Nocardioides albidus]|uniref:Uncharacterized protein n=1 Tax=Nocardioides albidus TaxID=1517589 RepID=A0A5C4WL57_9ACTN|nr:hypothetical protein FHP29_01845 [Nocardioides albidus]
MSGADSATGVDQVPLARVAVTMPALVPSSSVRTASTTRPSPARRRSGCAAWSMRNSPASGAALLAVCSDEGALSPSGEHAAASTRRENAAAHLRRCMPPRSPSVEVVAQDL